MALRTLAPRGLAGCLAAVLAAASIARPARADDGAKSPALDDARLDLSVPDTPAFTALGVSPSSISRPTNLRDLAIALASGVNGAGSVQNGLAIEVAPMKFFPSGAGVHRATPADLLLGGLAFSLGTNIAGTAPGETTSIAYAARWILGGYDPATDVDGLGDCLGAALTAPKDDGSDAPPPDPNAPVVTKATTDAPTIVKRQSAADCRAMFRAAHLTSFAVELAYAHIDQAAGSTSLGDIHPDDDVGWVSVSIPLPKPFRTFAEDDASFATALAAYESDPANSVTTAVKHADLQACRESQTECRARHAALWSAIWQYRVAKKPGEGAAAFAPILFGRVDSKRIDLALLPRQTQLQVSARLPYITDRWSAFAEGGYKLADLGGSVTPAPKNSAPLGIGGDVRLGDGTWVGLYFGYDAIGGALLSLANLRWAVGEKRPYSY
jgi:hypothetical protein